MQQLLHQLTLTNLDKQLLIFAPIYDHRRKKFTSNVVSNGERTPTVSPEELQMSHQLDEKILRQFKPSAKDCFYRTPFTFTDRDYTDCLCTVVHAYGIPKFYLVWLTAKDTTQSLWEEVNQSWHSIANETFILGLDDYLTITINLSLDESSEFIHHLVQTTANYLLAPAYSINGKVSSNRHNRFKDHLQTLDIDLPTASISIQLPVTAPLDNLTFLQKQIEVFLEKIYYRWQAHSLQQIANWEALQPELLAGHELLSNALNTYNKLDKQITRVASYLGGQTNGNIAHNSFYRSSTGWHLMFDGKIVPLVQKFDFGLNSIYELLRSTNQKIHVTQLQNANRRKFVQGSEVDVAENLSIVLDLDLDVNVTAAEERNYRQTLSALVIKENQKRSLKEEIKYWKYRILYRNGLLDIRKTKLDNMLIDKEKKSLKRAAQKLMEETGLDDPETKILLNEVAEVIGDTHESSQLQGIKNSVGRNIRNAINAMADSKCKSYFKNTIRPVNYHYVFDDPSERDWVLESE